MKPVCGFDSVQCSVCAVRTLKYEVEANLHQIPRNPVQLYQPAHCLLYRRQPGTVYNNDGLSRANRVLGGFNSLGIIAFA